MQVSPEDAGEYVCQISAYEPKFQTHTIKVRGQSTTQCRKVLKVNPMGLNFETGLNQPRVPEFYIRILLYVVLCRICYHQSQKDVYYYPGFWIRILVLWPDPKLIWKYLALKQILSTHLNKITFPNIFKNLDFLDNILN